MRRRGPDVVGRSCYDGIMSRAAVFLTLLAALAGTPLRQAEAASDASRILSKEFPADRLESVDGGVGDEADVSLRGGSQASHQGDLSPSVAPLQPPPRPVAWPAPRGRGSESSVRASWPPWPPKRRRAWLQSFLF